MAQEEEKKNTAKAKAPAKNKPGTKKSTPKTSGKVKGPMGVGEPSKSNSTNKKSTKLSQKDAEQKASDQQKQQQPAKLPEKTRNIEEHLTVREPVGKAPEKIKKKSPMHEKDNNPIILGESTEDIPTTRQKKATSTHPKKKPANPKLSFEQPLPEKVDAEEVKEKIKSRKKKANEDSIKSAPAKKMTRRKVDQSISAEEKAELPDTSISEDLKAAAKKSAKKLKDRLIPDKQTQDEFKGVAETLLPEKEEIKKAAGKIKEKLPKNAKDLVQKAGDLLPKSEAKKKKSDPR